MDKLTLKFNSGDTLYANQVNAIVDAVNVLIDKLNNTINVTPGGNTAEDPGTNTDPGHGTTPTTQPTTPYITPQYDEMSVTFDFNKVEEMIFDKEVTVDKSATGLYETFVDKTARIGNVTMKFFRNVSYSNIGLIGMTAQSDTLDALQALYADRETGCIITVPLGYRITEIAWDKDYQVNGRYGWSTQYDDNTYFTPNNKQFVAVRSTNQVRLTYGTADGNPNYTYQIVVKYVRWDEDTTENIYPSQSSVFDFTHPTTPAWTPSMTPNSNNGGRTNIDGYTARLDNVSITFNKYQDSCPYIQCINLPETNGPQYYFNPQSGSSFTISVSDRYRIDSIVFDKYTSNALWQAVREGDSMPQRAYGAGGTWGKNSNKQYEWTCTGTSAYHSVTFAMFDAGTINQCINQIAVHVTRLY